MRNYVQHTKRLLLESKEYGVNELVIFEVVVDQVEELESLCTGGQRIDLISQLN